VVGFAGVALLFATDLTSLGAEAVPMGLLLLVSPLAAAVGNLTVKRLGGGTSSVLLNRGGMLLGGVLLASLALATEDAGAARWSAAAIGSILYLSLIGTVVAFGLYFWLLRYAPAHQLALIAYVTPVIALALGVVLAAEPFGPSTLAGAALILSGVGLVMRPRSRQRPRAVR
jgi:drug/metabolite transporter (DMT)-like permease